MKFVRVSHHRQFLTQEAAIAVCGPFTPGLDMETKTVTLNKTKTEVDSDDNSILEDDHDDDSSAPSDTEEGTSPGRY